MREEYNLIFSVVGQYFSPSGDLQDSTRGSKIELGHFIIPKKEVKIDLKKFPSIGS